MPPTSDGVACHVVCARLRSVVADEAHVHAIEDAVKRIHHMTFHATELVSLHLARCLENGVPLPSVDQDFYKMALMEVTSGNGKRSRVDEELSTTARTHMPGLQPVMRKGLDQMMMAQAISLGTTFKTNLWYHFRKRVRRFVRCAWEHAKPQDAASRANYYAQMDALVLDICKPGGSDITFESGPEYREWLEEWRRLLGTTELSSLSMEANVRKHQSTLLHATWRMSRVCEQAGKRTMAYCPLRRQFRPAFCAIDTKALLAILDGVDTHGYGRRLVRSAPPGATEKPRRAKRTAEEEAQLEESKALVWSDVLHFNAVKHSKRWQFAGSLRTDGVSVRLLFEEAASGNARRSGNEAQLPRCGLYTIDQIKHHSRIQAAQIVGADPGKRELLVCVDADAPDGAPKGRKPHVRYTSAQRRYETLSDRDRRQGERELPAELKSGFDELASANSTSSYLTTLHSYFVKRRTLMEAALYHFEDPHHRERQWKRHIRGQKSLTDFVRRIRGLQRDSETPLVLAYGSWGSVAGRPGSAVNRNAPPCIGVGLRKQLANHFLVITTTEHYTSKTCLICGATCRGCEEVDEVHRARLLECATDDMARLPAHRYSVRGLRRCHNESCAAHLNRDYNAAINIQHRCQALLTSAPDPRPLTAEEVAMERRRTEIEAGS